jgi:hypothetical protein
MANNRLGLARAALRFAMVTTAFIASARPCKASNNCPWMNEATASGLLGGDAVGAFTDAAAGQPAVCTFTYDDQGAKRTLRITVEVTPDAHARVMAAAQSCGSAASPMKAIGNEAMSCAADDRKGGAGERMMGRVRDQAFTVTIASTLKNDPELTRDALKAKIYTAAEQVSGNLF